MASALHAFRRFDAEQGGGRNLEELFRPPLELMFVGSFDQVGKAPLRLLLQRLHRYRGC